jgi:hypothetical protein
MAAELHGLKSMPSYYMPLSRSPTDVEVLVLLCILFGRPSCFVCFAYQSSFSQNVRTNFENGPQQQLRGSIRLMLDIRIGKSKKDRVLEKHYAPILLMFRPFRRGM